MTSPQAYTARCADGLTLAYRVIGGGARAPMLTVHGLVSSEQHWTYFTPHFARERPVISWNYRGHGGQRLDDCTVTVEQFGDDAFAVWRAAAREPAVVVGLSFGVQVALELWRRHPEAVRGLILICGTAGLPLDGALGEGRRRELVIGALRALGRRRRIGGALLGFVRSGPGNRLARAITYRAGGAHPEACPPEVLDDLFAHASGLAPALVGNVMAAYLEHAAFDVLPTIRVPTLIIAGDADGLTPVTAAERMHREIPDSELVVIPGHTHLVQVEAPERVHAVIDEWLVEHGL